MRSIRSRALNLFVAAAACPMCRNLPPPGHPPLRTDAISAELFEEMLSALIDRDAYVFRLHDAEMADRKAMGNNGKPKRFAFWFALLVFWHEIGRPLTITIDPIDNASGGLLVEFIAGLSRRYIEAEDRTPHAIAAFVKRNREKVTADPGFTRRRFMAV